MRKIDLRPYKVRVNVQSQVMRKILGTQGVVTSLQESNNWSQEEIQSLMMNRPVEQDYAVKDSMINILFTLRVPGKEAWEKRDPLANKIQSHDGKVLLQTEEYAMLLRAFEQFQGSGKNEEELLKRVFEAKEVEVEEKKKGKNEANKK